MNLRLNDVQKVGRKKEIRTLLHRRRSFGGKFKRKQQSCLAPYQELLAELQSENTSVPATDSIKFNNEDTTSGDEGFQLPRCRKKR